MARQARINVAGGWYHVYNRGQNREAIFDAEGDYRHFLELVGTMHERYRVHVYAYALMGNHFHLLVGTPEGNLSRAMQWLGVSYGMWRNRKYALSGHVLEGRHKAILIEGQEWGLELSVYLHLNPVVTVDMGLSKRQRKMEQKGWSEEPSTEEVDRRLKAIREYPWSSYRAYAGYEKGPKWLNSAVLLKRCAPEAKDKAAAYRDCVEARLKQGAEESPWQKVRWGLVLGTERFARKVRGKLRISEETLGREDLRARMSLGELTGIVEKLKAEKWEAFRDRHGDWGRDLVWWAGRQYGGLRLSELAALSGVGYTAVSDAIRRLQLRSKSDRTIRRAMEHVRKKCKL
jgi:REP element-mobilizing transposase RayT